MELLAVIVALQNLKTDKFRVDVYSDSKYVIDSISKGWVFNWQKTSFKGKKNADLWNEFLLIQQKFNISWHWVKGHNGHPENERCDTLAVVAAENSPKNIDVNYENSQS
jgi:ribonuclease HI